MSMVDGSVWVVYQGAFLRRCAICVSGFALVVYHRTVMVWAMNVKGTLRWTAFSVRFWVSPTPVMFFPSWKQTSMDQRDAYRATISAADVVMSVVTIAMS